MTFEVFIGVFVALVAHSLMQTFVIDPLTVTFRMRKLEQAAKAFSKELDRVGINPSNIGKPLSNPARTRTTSPDRLSEIFESEMDNWRFNDKGPAA